MSKKTKKVDSNNLKIINAKINAALLILNLIKNNFEFEKNEMDKNEIKEWVLAKDIINDLLVKLINEKGELE